ncbi:MAG: type I 3-dehydroquinate dehydratase [Lachnospiraceae bacterium]|nr:type I 3-dehydroquinate dehydratase [Lachnospiraceae bacterium]
MVTTVKIRNLVLGQGRPKICIPIVAQSREGIRQAAEEIRALPADLVEWRADWYEGLKEPESLAEALKALRQALGEELALLFTIRTKKEGGQAELSPAEYVEANCQALESGFIDLVDAELSAGKEDVAVIVDKAHQLGKKVVMSSHDFYRTPEVEEMLAALKRMQEWNADIPKLAVMPKSRWDVLKLLEATLTMRERYADRPIVTMSMASEGVITRLCGEAFGSCMTFGSAGQLSAPGQMEARELCQVLEAIHKGMSV